MYVLQSCKHCSASTSVQFCIQIPNMVCTTWKNCWFFGKQLIIEYIASDFFWHGAKIEYYFFIIQANTKQCIDIVYDYIIVCTVDIVFRQISTFLEDSVTVVYGLRAFNQQTIVKTIE